MNMHLSMHRYMAVRMSIRAVLGTHHGRREVFRVELPQRPARPPRRDGLHKPTDSSAPQPAVRSRPLRGKGLRELRERLAPQRPPELSDRRRPWLGVGVGCIGARGLPHHRATVQLRGCTKGVYLDDCRSVARVELQCS